MVSDCVGGLAQHYTSEQARRHYKSYLNPANEYRKTQQKQSRKITKKKKITEWEREMHCYGYGYSTTIVTTRQTVTDSRLLRAAYSVPFSGTRSEPVKLPTRNFAGSLKAKASLNDEFVASKSQLSFYKLLGIPESGSSMEVKHAYKKLARKYHPDVSPPGRVEEYTKRFILVKEAYETLSDPVTRALYDRDLATGLHFSISTRQRYHHGVDQVYT